LLGANGAGKTTTFYMIVGLERPDSGSVLLGDQDLTQLPDVPARAFGYRLPAAGAFSFSQDDRGAKYSCRARNDGLAPARTTETARRVVGRIWYRHVRNTRGDALSGGERRRTEIARALATEPQYILLDEPFAGIDPKAVDDIQNVILYLRNRGIGILITDHNVRETLGVTDRAYIMAEGKIFARANRAT
jgi:lipopolysaccharide export system ATP-binding protein